MLLGTWSGAYVSLELGENEYFGEKVVVQTKEKIFNSIRQTTEDKERH